MAATLTAVEAPEATAIAAETRTVPVAFDTPVYSLTILQTLETTFEDQSLIAPGDKGELKERIAEYVKTACDTLENLQNILAGRDEKINTVAQLNSAISLGSTAAAQVVSGYDRLIRDTQREIAWPAELSHEIYRIPETARAIRQMLTHPTKMDALRDDFFQKEVNAQHVEKLDRIVQNALSNMAEVIDKPYVFAGESEAQQLPKQTRATMLKLCELRFNKLVGDLRENPGGPVPDKSVLDGLVAEISLNRPFRLPEYPDGLVLPQTLRAATIQAYRTLAGDIQSWAVASPTEEVMEIAPGIELKLEIDRLYKGTLTITHLTLDQSATYTFDGTQANGQTLSDYARSQRVQKLLEKISACEPKPEANGCAPQKASALSTKDIAAIVDLAGKAANGPAAIKLGRIPTPNEVPGFEIQHFIPTGAAAVEAILRGSAEVVLTQRNVDIRQQHKLTVSVENGTLHASLTGPKNKLAGEPLHVAVQTDIDVYRHMNRQLSLELTKLCKALSKSEDRSEVKEGPKGIVATLLAIPSAKVNLLKGVVFDKGTLTEVELISDGKVSSCFVENGGTLSVIGKSPTQSIAINNLRYATKSNVVLDLEGAVISYCKFDGDIPVDPDKPSLRNCVLNNTSIAGLIKRVDSSEPRNPKTTLGGVITDSNCTYKNCEWQRAYGRSIWHWAKISELVIAR